MGTNIYAERELCPMCNKTERVHIGKFSSGWRFGMQRPGALYPEDLQHIESIEDWVEALRGNNWIVKDEYGRSVDLDELLEKVYNFSKQPNYWSCGEIVSDAPPDEGPPYSIHIREFS